MQQTSLTPEGLILRARAGDLEAFGQLLARYRSYARLQAAGPDRHEPATSAGPLRSGARDIPRGAPGLPQV